MTHVLDRIHGRLHTCPWQLAPLLDIGIRRWLENPQKLLSPHIKEGQVVCDFGCGSGFFTLPMARMVGEKGRIHAVDIQPEMIEIVRKKAVCAGLENRIQYHMGSVEECKLPESVDFALAFYVIHEFPNAYAFFRTAYRTLKPGGRLYAIEPVVHVSKKKWDESIRFAEEAGFCSVNAPSLFLSRTMLLEKSVRL